MKRSVKLSLLALAACMALTGTAAPAFAETHGQHGGGPKYYNYHNNRSEPDGHYYGVHNNYNRYPRNWVQVPHTRPGVVVIQSRDRVIIHNYVRNHWRPLPIGYAPRYLIGSPLPAGITYYPLPYDVVTQLQPVPYGYRYVQVDDDILLLDATARVIDAVAHLSH